MNIESALKKAKEELKFVPDRDVDAAWIVCFVTGLSRGELRFRGNEELTHEQESRLDALLARRKQREPLQYIFGTVPFYNVELKCDSRALIPRDETACMAEEAIKIIKENNFASVLDLCTGSGAIAAAIKYTCPEVSVSASDISPDALALAKENAKKLNCSIEFFQGDLFAPLKGKKFDLIISNPPYIATKDMEKLERELSFEPQCALDGGADGLDFYRDIAIEAREHINKNGVLIMEIGFDEGDAIKAILARAGWGNIKCEKDYAGLDRVISCTF